MVRTARHTFLHFIEVVAGLIAVLIVGGGLLLWQISTGFVPLGPLTPLIQSWINNGLTDFSVDIDDASLSRSSDKKSISIRIVGVDFIDETGTLVGNVPEIEIDFDIRALASRQINPQRVELFGPSAAITRLADGSFELGLTESRRREAVAAEIKAAPDETAESQSVALDAPPTDNAAPQPTSQRVLSMLVQQIRAKDGAASQMKTFTIRDAKLDFYDVQSGTLWSSPDAVVSVDRKTDGVAWWMAGTFRVGPEEVEVNLLGGLSEEDGMLESEINFSNVHPSSFASKSAFFTDWEGFDFPVAGKAAIEMGPNGKIRTAELELAAGEGTLQLDVLSPEPIKVSYGAFSADYDGTAHVFNIKRLHYAGNDNRATLTGKAYTVFNTQDRLQLTSARFDLEGKDVSIFIPEQMDGVAKIDTIAVSGFADFEDWWLSLENADIATGETRLHLSGDIVADKVSPMIVMNGTVDNLEIDDLPTFWPRNIAPPARKYVTERINGGVITEGVLTIDAAAGDFAQKPVPKEAINFAFKAKGGSVIYQRGLPPAEDASADIVLTGQSLFVDAHGGIIRQDLEQPIRIAGTTQVDIPLFGIPGNHVYVSADLVGRAEDILALVDHEPLQYLTKFGLDPSIIHGNSETNLWFGIPLAKDILPSDIQFKAKGHVDDLHLTSLPNDLNVSDGIADIEVDLKGLRAEGGIRVEGVPVEVKWTEQFQAQSSNSSTFNLSAVVDDAARDEWGIDMLGYFQGPIPIQVVAKGRGTNINDLHVIANLNDAEVNIDNFAFHKPTGDKAEALLNVAFASDGAVSLKDFELSGDNLGIKGRLTLAEDKRLETAVFDRIYVDDMVDVAFTADRDKDGALLLDIQGKYLNAAPFLEEAMRTLSSGKTAKETPEEALPNLGWALKGQVDSLYMRGGVAVRNVDLEVKNDGERFSMVSLTGDMGDNGEVFAALTSGGDHKRHLLVTADDGGRVLEGLTGVDQVVGGELSLRMELDDDPGDVITADTPLTLAEYLNEYANSDGAAEGGDEIRTVLEEGHNRFRNIKTKSSVNGYLKLDKFKMVEAPILAQLLTVGSLRGLSDTLNGEGIKFDSLELPFWVDEDGVIGISDATASGPALGLTLYGTFDQGANKTDMQGTIVPSYTLNSALGNLPIFGPILVSREGEGVFAFTYGISGPTTGPTVYVNPLAGLAPGVLRRVFQPRDQLEARRVPIEELENAPMPVNPNDGAPEGLEDLPEELVDGPGG